MIEAILLAALRMADGQNLISRTVYVISCLVIVAISTQSVIDTAAWMWVLCVLTVLPTNALLSATHGWAPEREDGRWQFLQTAAHKICLRFPHHWAFFDFGIVYGAVRASLILPAALWIGEPWLALSLLQGGLYFVFGRITQRWAARCAEGVTGAFVGLFL